MVVSHLRWEAEGMNGPSTLIFFFPRLSSSFVIAG